jgi:DNA-binding Lrp family transcriptional regulator
MRDLDIKLIKELQEDGRASNKELARRLGMHPSTVSKKIKQLLDSGTIKIRALPNLNKLGYRAQALLIIDVDLSKIEEVIEALYEKFHVNMIITVFGRSNLLITVHYFNWDDLLHFISAELSGINGVDRVETHLIREVKQRYFGIFEDSAEVLQIDNIDQKIIERLAANGRYTAKYLASDIGISLPTCLRRINYLLKNNLITIKSLPNPTKFGYVADVFILMQVKPEHVESICSILSSFSDVHSLYVLFSSSHNILFGMHKKTPEELFNSVKLAMNKVSLISKIIDMRTYIRSEVNKRYYGGF